MIFLFVSAVIAAEESVTTKRNDICSSDEQTIFSARQSIKLQASVHLKTLVTQQALLNIEFLIWVKI